MNAALNVSTDALDILPTATKLLHAISAKRRMLTAQPKSRLSLQSIMGATDTRRSIESPEFSLETPIFPVFSVRGILRDFCEFRGVYELARGQREDTNSLPPIRRD